MIDDPYKVLGLERGASDEEVGSESGRSGSGQEDAGNQRGL